MISKTQKMGFYWETVACEFLSKQGLKRVDKNFRSPFGEIDLIMKEGIFIVFVEVRYRVSDAFGESIETVTPLKKRRLIQTGDFYLQKYGKAHDLCRFDVVGIRHSHKIVWIKDAFEVEY